ncbi:acyltransferase [Marinobacter sp.]|uniref:acyltransferase n=1 Tax=Marinobacter sp. TaxID=50741 RepID=UPI00257FB8AD|nr:acyltransferase [Marinobacter sp.]
MTKFIVNVFYKLKIDLLVQYIVSIIHLSGVKRLEHRTRMTIRFVSQGEGGLIIGGDVSRFSICSTSHLKSGTFIECSGGVVIGSYFHPGRALTIFSTNHNYKSTKTIPYDETAILKPVNINDFVWVGANVTIVPGVTVGEGAVIGAGSVVTKDVPDYAVVGGNPAEIVSYRDRELFQKLKKEGKFF